MKHVLTFILSVVGLIAAAETRPLEQYLDSIVKPCPFGQVPADFDPAADPTSRAAAGGALAGGDEVPLSEQQQALQQIVNATVIHIDPTTRVPWLGFTDATNAKAPRNHFVAEGASEDGWMVKEIDLVKKSAKLAKGEVEIEVVVGAPPPPRAGGRGAAGGAAPAPAMAARSGAPASQPGSMSGMRSLREAHREQEAAQLKELQASRQAMDDARRRQEEMEARQEQEKAEREAQRQVEREELKSLAERLEQRMAEARQQKAAEEVEADE